MSRFKAVGFDMDGTFLKTHVDYPKLDSVDRIVLAEHGVPFEEIDFGGASKRPRLPIKQWLDAHGRSDEWNSIYAKMDRMATDIECEFVHEATPFPGSIESISVIKDKGLKVGMLTRGSREYASRALGPLLDEFDFVMGRDYSFYDDAKPSPVAMIQFAEELGVEPQEIIYVGDNLTDWQSATGAGAVFVGVLTGSCTEEDWLNADPDMIIIESAGDIIELI